MNNYLYYSIIYAIEAVIFYMYNCRIFGHVKKFRKEASAILTCYFALVPVSILNIPGFNAVSFIFVNVFLFKYLNNTKLSVALFHAVILTALMSISELITFYLFPQLIIRYYREYGMSSNMFTYIFINKTFYFVLSQFICNIKKNKSVSDISGKGTLYLSLISIISVIIIVLFLIMSGNPSPNDMTNIIIICSFLMLILTILVFLMQNHYQQKMSEYMDMRLRLQKDYDAEQYYKALISHDKEQRVLIHDIKNHLNTIAALCKMDNNDNRITEYIDTILNNDALNSHFDFSDNETMNIILSQYTNKCTDNHITFITDVRSHTLEAFKNTDLTTLFCNLLDNSYTSALQSENACIELSIKQINNTGHTLITLVNSCDSDPFSPDGKLYTSKPNSQFHGYGIYSVQTIIKKYNGYMEQYYNNDLHEFHTIIYI